ncbi:hypothetical protein Y1Q_0019466 [Alligator mississippiensis]|uniref:Uncharacterized protein n=1 Tax=Alligator mississippiensis TaxID=8496 RepID=A0A151NMN6_ALLMI|nr:hypothetical protein Y1Q_0019466 [Alligator mississippiensis]
MTLENNGHLLKSYLKEEITPTSQNHCKNSFILVEYYDILRFKGQSIDSSPWPTEVTGTLSQTYVLILQLFYQDNVY